MVAEPDQESLVLRLKNVLKERLEVVMMGFYEMFLAAARIHDEPQTQRQVGAPREERHVLGYAVFEDIEIVFGEIGGRQAGGIAHRERDVDQVHVDFDVRWLLRQAEAGGQEAYEQRTGH